jgi:hypothetical protein
LAFRGRVLEYLEKRFGAILDASERTVTVGATPTLILRHDPGRFMWLIINLSSANGYIAFSTGVSSSFGMLLNASGGERVALADEDGPLPVKEVWGVSDSAGSTWYVVEVRAIG